MSILDLYKNPPNNGRQIRFKDGNVPGAESTYTPYQRNDQASLRNSQLHYEDPALPGAIKTLSIVGDFLIAHANEFSRPPFPKIRTLFRAGVNCFDDLAFSMKNLVQ